MIAYESPSDIPGAVKAIPGLTCGWVAGTSVYQMFIATNDATGEVWVVIRGTDFTSMTTWLDQDFNVNPTAWSPTLPGWPSNVTVSSDVLISQGAFNRITGCSP